MSSYRKRDDVVEFLYRVVERVEGIDGWHPHRSPDRTYVTLGAARGQRTSAQNHHEMYGGDFTKEYAIQRARVGEWEMLSDD